MIRLRNAILNQRLRASLAFNFSSGSAVSNQGITIPFTRANTKTSIDFEGNPVNLLSGEWPHHGMRRVENVLTAPWDFNNAAWTKANGSITATGVSDPRGGTNAQAFTAAGVAAGFYQTYTTMPASGVMRWNIWLRVTSGTMATGLFANGSGTNPNPQSAGITVTTTWQKFSILVTGAAAGGSVNFGIGVGIGGFEIPNGQTIHIYAGQAENVTGQSNQNPSEDVSKGVLSSPWHGANVDGVKWFPYQNGNSVSSNVVTEGRGADITPQYGMGIGRLPGLATSFFETPDSVASSITGDIDIRADLATADWTPGTAIALASKFSTAGNRSYLWYLATTGQMQFFMSLDGTATSVSVASDSAVSFTDGTLGHVRVTRSSATGNITFYQSLDGMTWVQVGAVKAGTAGAIFDGGGSVRIGVDGNGNAFGGVGSSVFRVQIRNGIDGTLAVDFDPSRWSSGSTFVSGTGETWTLNGGATVIKTYPMTRPEMQAKNVIVQSDDMTTWTSIGTPTLTTGDRCGSVVLQKLGDDAAGTLEGKSQNLVFTGDVVKTYECLIKQDTSTSSVIRIQDTTAVADRFKTVITWTNGVPTFTTATGTLLFSLPLSNGAWWIVFNTTAVTAANTNQLQVYPATDAALSIANTGIIQIGGFDALDTSQWHTHIPTAGAAVTCNADQAALTSLGSWFNPAEGTIVCTFVTQEATPTTGAFLCEIHDGTANERYAVFENTSRGIVHEVVDGGVLQASLATAALANGTRHTDAFTYKVNDFADSIDAGSVATDTSGTLPTPTRIDFGYTNRAPTTSQFCGGIQAFSYYPSRLLNARLQSSSAL